MRFRTRKLLGGSAVLGLVAGACIAAPASADDGSAQGDRQFGWELLDSGTDTFLNNVDAVSPDVAWIGSVLGLVLRTVDGGATFTDVTPPDSAEVAFVDVEASSAEDALLVAFDPTVGQSRIYRTGNGGETWRVAFSSDTSFLDCMAMFDRRHGFAFGDPRDGKFEVVVTADAGRSWEYIDPAGMPDALVDEAGLANSGNCAAATGRNAWFGTGFAAETRVFRSADFGHTWQVASAPVEFLIAGLDFRTNKLGLAVGFSVARTTDGGATWQHIDEDIPSNSNDVAWWSDLRGDTRADITDAQKTVFMFGEGSWVSQDRGKTWAQFSDEHFISVDCVEGGLACFAVGSDGRIAKLTVS
jgi:photosystem II stability/assembly factor-like uncharacterized protein